jgi:phosphohistidine swiveling domain-containing protein
MVTFQTVATFKTLDEIRADDLGRIGGKAFNCARLKQAGFPVPDGMVVPTTATDADVQQVASDRWLDAVPPGTRFAVRSSGIGEDSVGHSFAGIHETLLNVERGRLAEAVRACRRSAWSPQARAYRTARQVGDEAPRIGVLVQLMVPAVTSGVAFTVNPITGADELVINAAGGLGEALVSGQIDPDEFRIAKPHGEVLSSRRGSSGDSAAQTATLTPRQLADLAALLTRIEQHYGSPQDIEWCHDGQQFWVVQSRPVTSSRVLTPQSHEFLIPNPKSQAPNPESRIPNPDIEWTRANLAEVLPDQLSPQALDFYADLLNVGERRFFGRLMAPESELGPMVKAFHGRLYFNLSQLRHITAAAGAAFADTLRSMGHSEQIRPEDEIKKRPAVGDVVRALPDFLRLTWYDLRAERIFHDHQRMTERALTRLGAVDPQTQSDREIWATLAWWISIVPEALTAVFVMSSVQLREDFLRRACAAAGFPYDRLVYPQLAAGQRSVSTRQAIDLVALAANARHDAKAMRYLAANDGAFANYREALAGTSFLERFDGFLDQYGHRGRYESDWAIPRLHENPASALFAIQGHLHGRPVDQKILAERQEADAAGAWRAFEARLTAWQRWTLLPRVRATMKRLKKNYVWREQVRSDLTRVVSRVRALHLVLADRFVERGWLDRRDDYFLLHLDEVQRAAEDPGHGTGLRAIAASRAAQLAAERDLQLPLFMRESELPRLLRAAPVRPAAEGAALTGLCVSPGSLEADVVVMRDPSEFATMKRGAILVAPATDPSWTPLFTLASGVIVEVGGMLSHASTIAREYGLPALANVKDATRVLKTGDRVRLDASGGRVEKITIRR